jgi:hypothetical protein
MMRSFLFLTLAGMRLLSAQTALPTEWIDPDTGHRVIRLSREDGTASLYFHQNAYSADGKKLVVTNPTESPPSIWLRARSIRWSRGV